MAIASSRRLCAVSRLFAASARSVTGVSSVWVIFTAALIWVPPNRRIDTPQSENRTSRPLGIGGESEAGAAGIRNDIDSGATTQLVAFVYPTKPIDQLNLVP